MLKGEYGYAKQKAMEILVALGELYEADRMIPVSSVQVAGVSYTSLGEEGLEWIESLGEGRVEVLATLNPAGMDLSRWRRMGIPAWYASRQLRIVEAYRRLGVIPVCTCTPYFSGNLPKPGAHLAWSESSAVVFANSVLKARTNREGGPSALAAALTGRTPLYGLHLDENRKPDVKVRVEPKLRSPSDYSLLGFWVGRNLKGEHPFFERLPYVDVDCLKALGAAMAASGFHSIFSAEGLPGDREPETVEKVVFGEEELREVREDLASASVKPDLVCLGCPHSSLREMARIALMLRGRRVRRGVRLWVFASRAVYAAASSAGYVEAIEDAGGEVYVDGCPGLAPLAEAGFKVMATDSCKMWIYGRTLARLETVFKPTEDCIAEATR